MVLMKNKEIANKYDVFEWLKEVIDSCENSTHFYMCSRLTKNFTRMYGDNSLTYKIESYFDRKYFESKQKKQIKN